MTPVWKEAVDAAERFNDPGSFTVFIGYEWTSLVTGNNLHRVVIYRDGGDKAIQTLPYTNQDCSDPEDFWTAYDAKRFGTKPGKEVTMQLQERAYTSPIWYTPN